MGSNLCISLRVATFLIILTCGLGGVVPDLDHLPALFTDPATFWSPIKNTMLGQLNEQLWGHYYSKPLHIPLAIGSILLLGYSITRIIRSA